MPRSARPKRPRWKRRPEARPEEILDAALAVFGERGFAAARLDDVARRAGVSKGTLYLYFDSKEALFREMIRTTKGPALARSEALVDGYQGSSRELLVELVRNFWRHLSDPRHATVSRLVQGEIRNFPELAQYFFENVTLRARRLLERVLARGVAAGEFRPEQARFAARGIPAMVAMLAGLHCFFSQFDPDPMQPAEVAESLIDLMLYGVVKPGVKEAA